MFTNKDIEKYYDVTEYHYRLHWNLDQSRSLHYGLWDGSTKSFHEALLNTNKVLAQRAAIRSTETILDAGCGVGGSSIWLAKNIGCKVTGISLNPKQLEKAKTTAIHEDVSDLVNFEVADFTKTNFEDSSFDIVWAIESVCHASNKEDFLREAFRLLRPGGRLVLCDYFKKKDLLPKEKNIIHQWVNGWAIDDIPTSPEFNDEINKAGFIEINFEDATNMVRRSSRRMANAYYLGIIPSLVYNLIHRNVSDHGKNNVKAAYYQYQGLKKGLWKYMIVSATKT